MTDFGKPLMKIHSTLRSLGALSVMAAAASAALSAPDTSKWQCETCPFEKPALTGSVDAGLTAVSGATARSADFNGLDHKASLLLGGTARYRGADGLYGNFGAADLGTDARSLAADGGVAGAYAVRLGYDEIPRRFSDHALTPFGGVGTSVLSLPKAFAASTTGAMPLASTLQATDIGYKRSRLDLGATWQGGDDWQISLDARHSARDGTQRTSGSFFSTAAQLVAPLNQTTDEVTARLSYSGRQLQGSLAYQASLFRNSDESLTWANPFTAGTIKTGAGLGQLALAPDNEFHQLQATLGYQLSAQTRASADIAIGRMTQDAAYLASTLNTDLVVPGLPSLSLNGRASTLNASVRISSALTDTLRVAAALTRDERDNKTATAAYPMVSTDLFLGLPRSNQAFSFTNDKLKLTADYRGPFNLVYVAGAEYDARERTAQEVGTTREATVFARVRGKPVDKVSVALKLAHAERNVSAYTPAAWIDPAENPLLRKYNLAERTRNSAGVRADWTVSDALTVGLDVDGSVDDYPRSAIGLTDARTLGVGFDVSYALTEQTQLVAFAHSDQIHSRQAGSQLFAQPDWFASNRDSADVLGLSLRHAAIKDKLDVGGDLTLSRSRSKVTVDTGASNPLFPVASTALDSLKLFATYKLDKSLSLTAAYWFERYDSRDWKQDGVQPATIPNVLTFGEQPPNYRVNVLRLGMRYQF